MNRTDRLYALVEELRAVSPRPRSARWLAGRFEVSTRTIERDISALQGSGVPIWAEPGRTGGYVVDRAHTLPPVNLTAAEAVAMAVALHRLGGTPFAGAGATALRKLLAVMPAVDAAEAHRLADRVHLIGDGPATPVPAVVADAVSARRVLRLRYADGAGTASVREVEPLGYLGNPRHWYLLAWCRLRDGLRCFRTDRILGVAALPEVVTRELRLDDLDIPHERVRALSLV
ncbi:Predicted DNA-binding transcriptional regulator YafY, contains an HTH and WYL domains [Micromonospora purpureochromogenes]|uniref:Predicted DNA-binding transcriptional regulator YafY, contains an HTH and WYL domains n=1 Tax=Micromonospora purpureochromogenes TaxID=47872 RepID=A0A1C4WWP2_9ACTN|nr:WYL domain-containing protein [Micromonospora purpureochromogenes]SCF00642.1 Predicted DNA-binding transcriptional regulator YafY, contains an HTH and WYL domains [Micromonospora purpureochromogenes]